MKLDNTVIKVKSVVYSDLFYDFSTYEGRIKETYQSNNIVGISMKIL